MFENADESVKWSIIMMSVAQQGRRHKCDRSTISIVIQCCDDDEDFDLVFDGDDDDIGEDYK